MTTALPVTVVLAAVVMLAGARPASGQAEYTQPPINYLNAAVSDPVAKLQKRINAGKVVLARDGELGYLPSLLRAMDIPVSSQTLVFSKTSFQRSAIGPKHPRAIYFDDETYVGYVQDGDVLEIATTDPNIGTVFYTLDQHGPGKPTRRVKGDGVKGDGGQSDPAAADKPKPRFVRENDNCLQCHAGSATRDVPGLVIRSVFPDPRGNPILSAGTKVTTHESPLNERFGGWYVSGTHGGYDAQRHMGNLVGKDRDDPGPVDPKAGADVTDLSKFFDASAYPSPHSDIVALMVLSHQAEAHNLITRANYACRLALRDARVMNEALGRPPDELSDSTHRRINHPAEALLRYMLFCGEPPLAAPVAGTSTFAKDFAAPGPRDAMGRSLRDLDLTRRTFKYPLSYLIHSPGFDGLPEPTKAYVYARLYEVLTGKRAPDAASQEGTPADVTRTGSDKAFAHLSPDDRRLIYEILVDTKPDLPAYWRDGK